MFKQVITSASIFLLASCAPSILFVDTSCSEYKDANFNIDLIKSNKIAVLPVQGVQSKEQFRKPLGRELSQACMNTHGKDNVMSADEVTRIMSDYNLVNDYANGIRDYKTTGVLSSEHLKSIWKATGCEYAIFVDIIADEEKAIISTNQYGAATNVAAVSELTAEAQVWSLKNGDVVWEGKGGFAFLNKRVKFQNDDLISKVNKGLMGVLGQEKQGNCGDKSILVKAESDAYIKTLLGVGGVSVLLSLLPLLLIQ
jgi:hypothetical protein